MTTYPNRAPEGDWVGTQFLRLERQGSLAVLTIDRPHRRNAMTPAMYFGVRYAVEHVNRTDELAALVITGTGDVFCPGGDLGGDQEDGWADLATLLHMDNVPFDAVKLSHKPVVAAVNGLCQGGGLVITMLCDVAVASERATFRAPELLRGIADTNYAAVLPGQIGIPRARDMLLTGREVDAATALDWGLVTRVVAPGAELNTALDVARTIARMAPSARATVKRELNRQYEVFDKMSMVESLYGPEALEGFRAFKERRNPSWVPEDLRTDGRL